MSSDYFHIAPRRAQAKPVRSGVSRGTPSTGRIVKLLIGQGYGFIRLPNDRQIYFHRADVHEGVAFNAFRLGEAVTFELLEDRVSGARALVVRPASRR
jgi:cold shock CspA family protein